MNRSWEVDVEAQFEPERRGDVAGARRGAELRAELDPHPSSVGRARRLVRDALSRAGRDDLVDTAELVVSEVVTNAVVHAGTPVVVAVAVSADGVRVEVADGSGHLPSPSEASIVSETGNGLRLVEQLVDQWGVRRQPPGKWVWFELTTAEEGPSQRHTMRLDASDGGLPDDGWHGASGTVTVRLRGLPLHLHAAWQSHAQALLREYLLARLEDTDGEQVLEHAASSDALALLAEQAPDAGPPEPAAELSDDTEASDVVLHLPAGSVAHVALLNDGLESAARLADSGRLLTPAPPPEFRDLRRWICGEVMRQAAGQEPRPWAP